MALPVELLDYIFDIAIELIGSEDLGLRGSWSKRTRRSRRDPCLQARQEMSSLVLVSVYWAQRIRKKRFGAKVGLLNEEQATQFWDWARPSRVGRLECAGLIKHLKIRALPLWGEAESSGEQMVRYTFFFRTSFTAKFGLIVHRHDLCFQTTRNFGGSHILCRATPFHSHQRNCSCF